jgi:hypothetical protein
MLDAGTEEAIIMETAFTILNVQLCIIGIIIIIIFPSR